MSTGRDHIYAAASCDSTRASGIDTSSARWEGRPGAHPVTAAVEDLVGLSPDKSAGPPPATEGLPRLRPLASW